MMTEKWTRWEPIQGLSEKYYIDSVMDTVDGFTIFLSDAKDEEKKVKVFFKDSVDVYRSANESFRYQLIVELKEKYGSDFYGDWTFFKVENSSYVQWLLEQSAGIADGIMFTHFSFIASDSVLDILDPVEPKVELI